MKQRIGPEAVTRDLGAASSRCWAQRRTSVRWAPAVAVALLLAAVSGAVAQEEPARSDCLQDKKLDVAHPRTDEVAYRRLRNENALSDNDKLIIDRVVKFYVYQLSWPEERKELNPNRESLLNDVNDAPSQAFRREARKALLKYVPDLFDNHCVVRMAAALLLAEIEDPADLESGVALLIAELTKPDQDEAVKLQACRGIQRLATTGFRFVKTRNNAISALVNLLGSSEELNPWTRVRAIEALRAVAAYSEARSAVGHEELLPAVQALLQIVHESGAEPRVRVHAAETIGALDVSALRVKLNYALVAHEIAVLAVSLGKQYVERFEELEVSQDVYWWQFYFAKLVKSFRGDHRATGLLRMAAADPEQLKLVQEAEARVVAITKAMLDFADTGDIAKQLDELQAWVDQNPPSDRRLAPPLPELTLAASAGSE